MLSLASVVLCARVQPPAAVKGSSFKDYVTLDPDVELSKEEEEELRRKSRHKTMARHEAEEHHAAADSAELDTAATPGGAGAETYSAMHAQGLRRVGA